MSTNPTIEELLGIIKKLEAKVAKLEAELSLYKKKKNSNNSHIPPSKDENRPLRNQSLREKTGKSLGGQKGHQGKTLELSTNIDHVIEYVPTFCNCCGKDISGVVGVLCEKRQVIDIPVIKAERTEYQIFNKTCSCGHTTSGEFPHYVTSPVQYGSNVEALIAYMHTRQYLPFNRMKEFFSDVMGLPVSEGGLHHILARFGQKALPVYAQIKERIKSAVFVGTDETGAKVNGEKHWFWTWQNDALTFIVHSDNRGFETIESTFENGLPDAILQHDRWASHFLCNAQGHQICIAHLLRDLNYIQELYQSEWAKEFKTLLQKAIEFKKGLRHDQYFNENIERQTLVQNLYNLLISPQQQNHKKAITLQKSLIKHKHSILSFLYHPKVPPDNNGSERAIRNIKVKQKISGQFKSSASADCFAVIRSVIDTTIKSGQNVLDALVLIARFGTN